MSNAYARQPTPNRTRYARQMAAKLDANARLFHDLRRPVPPNPRAIAWNIQRMRRMVDESHAPSRQRRRFNEAIGRVESNILGLRALSLALYHRQRTPKQIFMDAMRSRVEEYRGKEAEKLLDGLHQIPEKDIQVRVDWTGPHFFVEESHYPAIASTVRSNETFNGISLRAKEMIVRTPTGSERISNFPFSIVLVGKENTNSTTSNHERWHDFEKITNTLKSSHVEPSTEYMSPQTMQLRLEGWFQNELSATIFGSGRTEIGGRFPERIKSFFKTVRGEMKANPEYKKWKDDDWKKLDFLQRELLHITRVVQNTWKDPSHIEVDAWDLQRREHIARIPSSKAAFDANMKQFARERARAIQYSSMLLATLISTTPIRELEKQLQLFAETNHFDGRGLPHRRFPKRY